MGKNDSKGRVCMNILFLGNCQVNALRGLSREMFPDRPVQFRTITPFWGKYDEDATRQELETADLVISQAIENPEAPFNIADVRASTRGEVVFVPYVYIDGIASLEIIGSKGKSVIKGAEPLLRGQEDRKAIHIFNDYCAGKIDMEQNARVESSLAKMREKEGVCDLTISDYLTEIWQSTPTLYGINHPTQHVIFEMHRRLCDHLNWRFDEDLAKDPISWGRRALPQSQRALSPIDKEVLGLTYDCDTHWYGQAHKLLQLALKAQEKA